MINETIVMDGRRLFRTVLYTSLMLICRVQLFMNDCPFMRQNDFRRCAGTFLTATSTDLIVSALGFLHQLTLFAGMFFSSQDRTILSHHHHLISEAQNTQTDRYIASSLKLGDLYTVIF